MPGRTAEQAREWFLLRVPSHPRRSLLKQLDELVPERLAEALCRQCWGRSVAGQCTSFTIHSGSSLRGPHPVSVSCRARSRVEFCRGDGRGDSVGGDQFPHDGVQARTGPVCGRGGARLRRPDRRVQFSMGLGDRPVGRSRCGRECDMTCGRRTRGYFSSYPTPKMRDSSSCCRPGAGCVFSRRSYSTLKNKFL